jgi:DNA-binding SARP family transcriptional activator
MLAPSAADGMRSSRHTTHWTHRIAGDTIGRPRSPALRPARMVEILVRDEPSATGRMDHRVVRGRGTGVTVSSSPARPRALPLARLDALLDQAWQHRLTLIVAPAGSGKSTLLSRFVDAAPGPVAWYRADAWDRDPVRMLRRLEAALRVAAPTLPAGWETMQDALEALDASDLPAGLLLVVDDLHALAATDAERDLERLIERSSAGITIVAASRTWPDMNLPRFKVAGELLEIGVDDLRFRSWEVEQLFRDVYGQPLPPEEVAALTRRTEGWAAGLQLFHLATRGRSPADRRALLTRLGRPASRLTGEYLSRNVLTELPAELAAFLVETSVLGRLTGGLCDELLGTTGSAALLRELEARCLFTLPLADTGAYRYHEVFRLHLLGVLVESVGEGEARRRHLRAGELLTRAGALPEALDALARAEAWVSVASLLGRDGGSLAVSVSAWTGSIPPSLLRTDPWLLLAQARALRAQGHFREAAETYAEAATAFGDTEGAATSVAERSPLLPWLDPDPPRALGSAVGPSAAAWSSALRAATVRDPAMVAARATHGAEPAQRLVVALAALLAGEPDRAASLLGSLLGERDELDLVSVTAMLVRGVIRMSQGDPGGPADIRAAIGGAESSSLEWLELVGRSCLSLGGVEPTGATGTGMTASPWVAAMLRAIDAWSCQDTDARGELLGAAAIGFRRLGAPVIEAWLRAFQALAMASSDEPQAEQVALGADALARTAGVAAARGLAQLALAHARGEHELARSATAILADAGLLPLATALGGVVPPPAIASVSRPTMVVGVQARCFGPLDLVIDGQPVDVAAGRPRVRSLLRLLLAEPGRAIHHEVIAEAFWPEALPDVGARNLHAAIAALRRLVEPGATRGSFRLVVRDGASYRFALPPGSDVDVLSFDAAIARAKIDRATGDATAAEAALRDALTLYRGDLFADEGPASWLEEPRERRRRQAVEAASVLAAMSLDRGDLEDAAETCSEGLRIDRYHDPLWRLLIRIRERAGDAGEARRARQGYGRVLTELGVTSES